MTVDLSLYAINDKIMLFVQSTGAYSYTMNRDPGLPLLWVWLLLVSRPDFLPSERHAL